MNGLRKSNSSPRAGEVGEIDTRAPFQSVKAAVSLFGEVAFPKDRSAIKRRSSENVFEKETQLILAQKELSKIKKQMENADATKAKALSDLEKAKMALHNLTTKLANMRESKNLAIEAAEAVKNKGEKLEKKLSLKAIGFEAWKQEVERARKEYTTTIIELDASKQDLTKIRQDFEAALEEKLAALQAVGEAQRTAKFNSERVDELSSELANMKVRASIEELKLGPGQDQEGESDDTGRREVQLGCYKAAKEAALEKLGSLKGECDPELIKSLDAKLADTSAEIEALQEKMKKVHASEMDSVRSIISELKEATKTLQGISAEESSLKSLVYSLRTELKQLKKEKDEVKEKQQVTEALASTLSGELKWCKGEPRPKPGSAEEKEAETFYEHSLKIRKLSLETEDARKEAQEMSRKVEELKLEAEKSRAASEEAEKKLQLVMKDAKDAKAAEQRAIEVMEHLADVQNRVSNSKAGAKIKMSKKAYESLSAKTKECEELVEKKVAAAMAEVQEIYLRKNEVDRKVEANLKAIQEMKVATEMAMWHAEMASSAKMAVESAVKRLRQQKQKVAAADAIAPSQKLAHSENTSRPIPLTVKN